jgi:hypothetical protein
MQCCLTPRNLYTLNERTQESLLCSEFRFFQQAAQILSIGFYQLRIHLLHALHHHLGFYLHPCLAEIILS